MRALPSILVLLVLAALPVSFAVAEKPLAVDNGISLVADTLVYDRESDLVDAQGTVRISWRGMTLLTEHLFLKRGENKAETPGWAVLERDGDLLSGTALSLDLDKQVGSVRNGTLTLGRNSMRLSGQTVAKTGPDDYHLDRGSFTTCIAETPSWKFTAADLDITLGEYATGRHALFYLKDVPVLYFPYLVFPVMTERQSGLLLPRIGSSSKKGFYLDLAWYWAISPSSDATIDLDTQTKRGVGVGLEYRYIRKAGSDGEFHGYGIIDTSQDRFRGTVSGRHEERFSPAITFKSSINMTTDRDFLRDYGEATGEYNRKTLDSSLSLTGRGQQYVALAEAVYVEDLDAPDNKNTLQELPRVTVSAIRQRLGTSPVAASFDFSLINFYRDTGTKGERLELHPTFFLPLPLADGVAVTPWAGYRQRFYQTYDGGGAYGSGLPEVGADLSARLTRVYDMHGEFLQRVRHLLVPSVSYHFVPDQNQDYLPFFDYDDRIVPQNMVTYSLESTFTGKFVRGSDPPVYRDLFYLRLSNGYELGGTRRDLLSLFDEGHPLTNIRVETRISPAERVRLSAESRYDLYQNRISTADVTGEMVDSHGNLAGAGYHYGRDAVHYFEGKLGIGFFKPFMVNYQCRYSFDRDAFLESLYSLEYKHQCWSVTLLYRDRPDNREFLVTFNLAGVGGAGPVKAF